MLTPDQVDQIRKREEKFGDVNAGDVTTLCNSHDQILEKLEEARSLLKGVLNECDIGDHPRARLIEHYLGEHKDEKHPDCEECG